MASSILYFQINGCLASFEITASSGWSIIGTTALGLLQYTKLLYGQRASTKSKPSLFTFTVGETTRQPREDKDTRDSPKECLKWIKPGRIRSCGKCFRYIRSVSNLVVLHRHLNLLKASKNIEEAYFKFYRCIFCRDLWVSMVFQNYKIHIPKTRGRSIALFIVLLQWLFMEKVMYLLADWRSIGATLCVGQT